MCRILVAMCRILVARIESPKGVKLLGDLLPAFHKASSMDNRLKKAGIRDARHCHGYGYILLADKGDGLRLYYRRVDTGLAYGDREESCIENLKRLERDSAMIASILAGARRVYLILHSRRATGGRLRGVRGAHPFHVKAASGVRVVDLYLAHNGSLKQEELEEELGLAPGLYVDSHMLAMWIARRIEDGLEPEQALAEGMVYTRSAYIVSMLAIGGGRPTLYYAAYLPSSTSEEWRRYYQPYLIEGPGARILASSTIADYASWVDSRPVEPSRRVYTL